MSPRALLVCGAVLVSGCSLIYAGDLDHASESPTAGVSEGGTLPDGAGDASGDASRPDSGSAGNGRGCTSYVPAPKFCKDFDDDLPVEDGWGSVDTEAGQSTLESTTSYSAPRSLKVTLATSKACQYSRVERSFEGLGGTKRLELHVRIRPATPWNDYIPFVFGIHSGADTTYNSCGSLLYVLADNTGVRGLQINVQSAASPNDIRAVDGVTPLDEWSEVDVVLTPASSGQGVNYHFKVTPESGPARETDMVFDQCNVWEGVDFYLGFHCAKGNATAYYDDVRVDWQ